MTNEDILKKDILEQVSTGDIKKEIAFRILKQLNVVKDTNQEDIAIIGVSCRFPNAKSVSSYWHVLQEGINCIREFPKNRLEDVFAACGDTPKNDCPAGYLDEIDKCDAVFFGISPREALLMEPAQRLLLEVVYESMEDAGYGGKRLENKNVGVYIGRDHLNSLSYLKIVENTDLMALTGSFPGLLSSRISYALNLHGPAMVIDTTCSSGLVAVHTACKALKNNECPLAVAAGINLLLYPMDSTNKMGEIESTEGVIRVFDKNSKGTVWGEGIASILLKPLSKAVTDRDNIYAVIKGSAVNNDGATNGITSPNAKSQTAVILNAWKDAKIQPETISYIETHGTGTVLGDPIEIKSLIDAFNKYTSKRQFCGIGSVKTNIGHTVGVSGLASLLKVVLALKYKTIPQTINFTELNPYINLSNSPFYINDKTREWNQEKGPRRAGISAFGFSGTNCHVVLEEAPEIISTEFKKATNILVLSAKSEKVLYEIVKNYLKFLQVKNSLALEDICYTTNTGRGHYTHRLVFIIETKDELICKFNDVIKSNHLSDLNIKNVYYGVHKVVSNQKIAKENGDITYDEKKLLDEKALLLVSMKKENDLLERLCMLYIKGAEIHWSKLYQGQRKISLPTYPFDKVRFWPKAKYFTKSNESVYFHQTTWKLQEASKKRIHENSDCILVIKGETPISYKMLAQFKEDGRTVIEVMLGESFKEIKENSFMIDGTSDSYNLLFKNIDGAKITHIIFMTGIIEDVKIEHLEQLHLIKRNGIFNLSHLVNQLNKMTITQNIKFVIISNYVNQITSLEDYIYPENSALFSFCKVLSQENARLKFRCIDIDNETDSNAVVEESLSEELGYQTAFRNNKMYIEELDELDIDQIKNFEVPFKDEGVYIITGGTGDIGLKVAEYLFAKGALEIALISRHGLPEREEWDKILSENVEEAVCERLKVIKRIEKTNTSIETYRVNISNEQEMKQTIQLLKQKHHRINGIFHLAGLMHNDLMVNKTDDNMEQILSPKMDGTWILHQVTKEEDMDFFVMFSSVASVIGGSGQCDYAAANAYLDAFATYRNHLGKRTIVIDWPAWENTGLAKNAQMEEKHHIFQPITSNKAIEFLDRIMHKDLSNPIVGLLNYNRSMVYLLDMIPINLSKDIKSNVELWQRRLESENKQELNNFNRTTLIKGKAEDSYNEIEKEIAMIWAKTLELQEIDIYESFNDLGGDSILAARLAKNIEIKFPGAIDVSDIYAYPSVYRLSEYISRKDKESKQQQYKNQKETNQEIPDHGLMELIQSVKSGKTTVVNGLDMIKHLGSEE